MRTYEECVSAPLVSVYFKKDDTTQFQVYPAPEDLKEWYVVEVSNEELGELYKQEYDVATGTLVSREYTTQEQHKKRQIAYKEESDPLFMAMYYDQKVGKVNAQNAERAWVDKVTEIKQRYPLPKE